MARTDWSLLAAIAAAALGLAACSSGTPSPATTSPSPTPSSIPPSASPTASPSASPTATATAVPIGPGYFGVNSGRAGTDLNGDPFFGTVRLWDQPASGSTLWCDVQPGADDDVASGLADRLEPALRTAADSGARRVVLVLGPAPAWVYGSSGQSPLPGNLTPWYCGGDAAATAVPSPEWLGTAAAPGPARKAWSAYVDAVLQRALAQFDGGLPFELDLQALNEPNWTILPKSGVPHSATSLAQIADSLVGIDAVVRERIDALPAGQRSRVRLLTSPISSMKSALGSEYLTAAEAAQAQAPVYDGVSFHSYSRQTEGGASAEELIAGYNTGSIADVSAFVDGLPLLSALPRHQTETNHGLALPGAPATIPDYSDADEAMLAARLYVDGLRWGLSSQSLYASNPALRLPTGVTLEGDDLVAPDEVVAALRTVRGWLVGRELLGCTTDGGVQACTLRDPESGAESVVLASALGAPVTTTVPPGVTSEEQISGEKSAVTPGQPLRVTAAPVLLT